MLKLNKMAAAATAVSMASGLMAYATAAAAVLPNRPDQYVVLAFDGSKRIQMWEDSRKYARDMTAKGKELKFTYFVNAAYYLAPGKPASRYNSPDPVNHGPGKSAIGFSSSLADVLSRLEHTKAALGEGNEIANHAAGHWDGTQWSSAAWDSEFKQFYDILYNVFTFNDVPSDAIKATDAKNIFTGITGFRAPQLGHNDAMFELLPKYLGKGGYDTSLTAPPTSWPTRNKQGLWSFPLASINIAGTSRKTLSMDYNFYYAQSNAKDIPARKQEFEDQMFYSYVNYFFNNYNGNRAPVNIGHHFSPWNGGAYWAAEQRFAELVCGMPEVHCVTYQELVQVMNQAESNSLIAAYAAGKYANGNTNVRRPAPGRGQVLPQIDSAISDEQLMIADPAEAHELDIPDKKTQELGPR